MIDAIELLTHYFNADGTLKLDANGTTLLNTSNVIQSLQQVPYNQLPNVTKIFDLKPAKAGALFAGIAVIDGKSVQNLIDDFLALDDTKKYLRSYTISGLAKRLGDFIWPNYAQNFPVQDYRPELQLILGGYSTKHNEPEIVQVTLSAQESSPQVMDAVSRGSHWFAFGGQHDVIDRVVYGLDLQNYSKFRDRVREVLEGYRSLAIDSLTALGHEVDLPDVDDAIVQLNAFDFGWVERLQADVADFSEQAAIDIVDFLVDLMIKAQRFSNRLQTVGGGIHIALVTKRHGFRWVSKEEFNYRDHAIPKHV